MGANNTPGHHGGAGAARGHGEGERPVLVVGAAGQVGAAVVDALGPRRCLATVHDTPPAPEHRGDLAGAVAFDLSAPDAAAVARRVVAAYEPAAVVMAAALASVERCEAEPELARHMNALVPGAFAEAAAVVGAAFVLCSSEYVFDGRAGLYDEAAPPRPVSVYGRAKREAEQRVSGANPRALVVRTTVVYGPEERGVNYAYQVADRLNRGDVLRAPQDQSSSPTYNRDLAAAIAALLERGASGVYNVAGPEVMDRATFAARLARAAGLDAGLVEAVDTPSLSQQAARPLQAGLVVGRLHRQLPALALRTVEDAVADWRARPAGRPWPGAAVPVEAVG